MEHKGEEVLGVELCASYIADEENKQKRDVIWPLERFRQCRHRETWICEITSAPLCVEGCKVRASLSFLLTDSPWKQNCSKAACCENANSSKTCNKTQQVYLFIYLFCLQHTVCVMADGERAVVVQGQQGDLLL